MRPTVRGTVDRRVGIILMRFFILLIGEVVDWASAPPACQPRRLGGLIAGRQAHPPASTWQITND